MAILLSFHRKQCSLSLSHIHTILRFISFKNSIPQLSFLKNINPKKDTQTLRIKLSTLLTILDSFSLLKLLLTSPLSLFSLPNIPSSSSASFLTTLLPQRGSRSYTYHPHPIMPTSNPHPFLLSFLLLFAVSAAKNNAANSQPHLTLDYYSKSCPMAEQIVSDVAMDKQIAATTTAAGTLRLFFHDCFVGGCDASVLVSTNNFNRAERDDDINLSLPGDAFDTVIRAKTKLELQCPNTVSCSDILALAARDLLTMVGGPYYKVFLGRKDALVSSAASAHRSLPLPNMTISQIIDNFQSKGFTVREMVVLSGAHTVGFSHCKEFADRIFNFNGGGPNAFDPTMHPKLAEALQKGCANYLKDPTMAAFNDVMTPGKFDNMYFQNLEKGLGLLKSDQDLMKDSRTEPIVREYAKDQNLFFKEFASAMEKLSLYGVKSDKDGEVRRRCDVFNNLNVN